MQNIELKVKIKDARAIRQRLSQTGCRFVWTMRQVDRYFKYPGARLKLRDVAGHYHELIFYQRPNQRRSRLSTYTVKRLSARDARTAHRILNQLFGTLAIIRKRREFWRYKHTRIHLDTVAQLGTYLELETIARSLSVPAARREHTTIKRLLGLDASRAIGSSYSDLLLHMQ
ncbi:MAG: class IV adenylate cyclase [Patescibacteria group bacterium]|nr:class IV adenylate cyclase [Patescibacteria group bacterium]MDD5715615.1 class IV adenylate cyclase [Patescibacteria group bacterium]